MRIIISWPIHFLPIALLLFVSLLAIKPAATVAQTNSNLLAPSHQANLQTACIEFEDGTFKLIRSSNTIVTQKIGADSADANIEVVKAEERELDIRADGSGVTTQTYIVSVPYTEVIEVEGKSISIARVRSEERTREVQVENAENSKLVEFEVVHPNVVGIPNELGEIVRVANYSIEKQSRVIGKDEELVRKKIYTSISLKPGAFKFYDLDGASVSEEQAARIIVERCPVIVLHKDDPILDEYYKALLNPKTLLVFVVP